MKQENLLELLVKAGKDPSRLIFEDELTGIYNRRFLLNYLEYKVPWDTLDDYPLSVVMIDLDYFKQINDQHGHDVGDQALIYVSNLMKEAVGEEGMAIRYAGDEFLLLLPRTQKGIAKQVGERLIQSIRSKPMVVQNKNTSLRMTLSLGVATAPDDAQTRKDLIQKADTALYHAKKSGRDGMADAAELEPQKIFAKAALQKLEGATIAGRGVQLLQVAEALKKFGQGHSQFLLVRGTPGLGKTTFLDTVRRNIGQNEMCVVHVNGVRQEMFRPYYLTTQILIGILNQKEDKGVEILATLSPEEIRSLAKVMPGLALEEQIEGVEEGRQREDDDRTQREALFATLLRFMPKLVGERPLVILVDDLEFSDEATLLLLRLLMIRRDLPVFVCATATDTGQVSGMDSEESGPLEKFYASYHEVLGIDLVCLTPLTAADIANHLRGIFPQVNLPEKFVKDLAQVSQGNPLFLAEVLNKLVVDQKIVLRGQQWVLEEIEEEYLPRSLEDIVAQKIATLDEESRQLLAQASTFGEGVSLSYLAGSSDKVESKIREFIDVAVGKGLLTADFDVNDETIRFLGRRVQEITYGGLDESRRQELHQKIGTYQETLYEQRLLPSAASLAYHFKRSTDSDKAKKYSQLQAAHNQKIFNAQEAIHYTGDLPEEVDLPDTPLDPATLPLVPHVIRGFLTAVRNIKLYPPESKALATSVTQVKDAINQILAQNKALGFSQVKGVVLVNGQKVDLTEMKGISASFVDAFGLLELEGVGFYKGLTDEELKKVIDALGRTGRKEIERGYWRQFAKAKGLTHIILKQVHYTEKKDLDTEAAPSQILSGEHKLSPQDMPLLHEILRSLLSASRNIKLYPATSQTVVRGMEQVTEAVQRGLTRLPVWTLTRVGRSFLVNGEVIDTSTFKTLAEGFLDFLKSIGISSLTFLEHTSAQELQAFIQALKETPSEGITRQFWARFAKEQGVSGILFDRHLYELREDEESKESVAPQALKLQEAVKEEVEEEPKEPEPEPEPEPQPEEPVGDTFESLLQKFPARVNELLVQGKKQQVRQMVGLLFDRIQERETRIRHKILENCRDALEGLSMGFQHHYIELVLDPLIQVSAEEKDLQNFRLGATLLRTMASKLMQFAEYPLATKVFSHLNARRQKLQDIRDKRAEILTEILKEPLDPALRELILEDLHSGEGAQQRTAAQLLWSLGLIAVPLLLEIIKQAKEARVRNIAAGLLADMGPEAAKSMKRELVLEGSPQGRVRILDVIDRVDKDLRTEFVFAMGDENKRVREAAFRLAERLQDDRLSDLLLHYARKAESDLAASAIRCLGKLKPVSAVKYLVGLLNRTKDPERVVACCRALGQMGDPAAIEPLAMILAPKKWYDFGKGWSPQVRGTAAFALGQIADPHAGEVLAEYVNDPEPRVVRIARLRARREKAGR